MKESPLKASRRAPSPSMFYINSAVDHALTLDELQRRRLVNPSSHSVNPLRKYRRAHHNLFHHPSAGPVIRNHPLKSPLDSTKSSKQIHYPQRSPRLKKSLVQRRSPRIVADEGRPHQLSRFSKRFHPRRLPPKKQPSPSQSLLTVKVLSESRVHHQSKNLYRHPLLPILLSLRGASLDSAGTNRVRFGYHLKRLYKPLIAHPAGYIAGRPSYTRSRNLQEFIHASYHSLPCA